MRFTYQWLRDFIDVKDEPATLAEKLTMVGLEVKSCEPVGEDILFEAEVTSNRPDWLSVVGIAREVASLSGKRLRVSTLLLSRLLAPAADRRRLTERVHITVKNDDKKDCPVYTAHLIKNVRIKPSPAWLRQRLELIGCRSVNNVVDATNYVMFSWGQPLHAFDLAKFSDEVVEVRRGRQGEKLQLIDGTVKECGPDTLLIATSSRPVAVAGVMGGKDTEVDEATRDILLEAAVFNPVVVRRGSRLLGLQSDSSYRFERGVDAEQLLPSVAQAVRLIQEQAGGEFLLSASSVVPPARVRSISLDVSRAQQVLGIDKLAPEKVRAIFDGLGFIMRAQTKSALIVDVPSFRQDVTQEADLHEEIARVFGYDRIPATIPSVIPQLHSDARRRRITKVKEVLAGLGLQEAITYSLIPRSALASMGRAEETVSIANPLSQEQECLRPTLMPSLLRCVSTNLNQKQPHVAVFEVADTYRRREGAAPPASSQAPQAADEGYVRSPGDVAEELTLGIALCGSRSIFTVRGVIKDEMSLLHLKGMMQVLCERLGIEGFGVRYRARGVAELLIGDAAIGSMSTIAGARLEAFDIKYKEVMLLELSLEKLLQHAVDERRLQPLPLYPAMTRDISCVIKESISADEILRALREGGGTLLREASIVDYYRGAQIPEGFRGLTVSCLYRSEERTLTDEEVQPVHAGLARLLEERFEARIRSRDSS